MHKMLRQEIPEHLEKGLNMNEALAIMLFLIIILAGFLNSPKHEK
ncbi:MAG: hypothetical protein QW717_08020 [Candidatus Bathyarchaeia archaeon]